ncbi:hypothetical protein ACHAW6_010571 [Cyclotella cf. meneghiniana]
MIVSFRAKDPIHDENWSPRRIASLIAKRQSSGEDAKCLIAPVPIEVKSEDGSDQSYTATRHPSSIKPPKNFVKANRHALREQQRINKNAVIEEKRKEENKQIKIDQKKQQRFGNVKSRVCAPGSSSTDRQQAQYAAASHTNKESPQSLSICLNSDDDAKNNQECHIAFGRKVPSRRSSMRVNTNERQSGDEKGYLRHKSFGKTPAYITNRRAKLEREEHERILIQQNAPPAPGLVLMEEAERLETLRLLEENEKIERDKLRNIPFAMNGHRAARIREAIEFRLKEIEDAKKIFSKQRVFVAQCDT